jgi:hypothetical protein
MRKAKLPALGLCCLWMLGHAAAGPSSGEVLDSGTLTIYFKDEKVGYEDYSWIEEADGYELRVSGRMAQPFRLEIESMTLRLSKDLIPREYHFQGALNGMSQEITSRIQEGRVQNTIRVAGQENVLELQVRRDTLVLPNPLFSPYVVLAKKYGCGLKDKAEVSVYMIPQVEMTGTLQSAADNPCALTLDVAGGQVLLVADAEQRLTSLSIPGQSLRVTVQHARD